jgi:hypothetical protein
MLKGVLIAAIDGYRALLAPLLPPSCRFHPSCSAYAREAIATRGAAVGAWLTARRLLKCQPWHRGGFDPVPPARNPVRSTHQA